MKSILIIFLFLNFIYLKSQIDTTIIDITPTLSDSFTNDSLNSDTLSIQKILSDSLSTPKAKSSTGLDTIIEMKSNDTISLNLKSKRMRLKSESIINMGGRNLEADEIIVRFDESTLEALSGKDSLGNNFGYPKLIEKGEEYYGERILYNYKTSKGVISQGETELSEGYYYGKKIKRISANEFNIQDGYYTPCNEESPSAYFGSTEMKMIGKSKIFLDPIIFYVQDMPLLVYPFGLFFNMQSGRRSGFIIPQFDFSSTRGLVFQEFGYYFAASDYWDTKLTADFYSKGGFVAKSYSRFRKGDELNGTVDIQWGKTRFDTESEMQENYSVNVSNFNWAITPEDKISGNLIYKTQDFNRRTVSNLSQRVTQNASSNLSYAKNSLLVNGDNLSVNYSRNQQLITGEYDQTPRVEYNLPNKSLFKLYNQDFNFSYGVRGELYEKKSRLINSFSEDEETLYDTTFSTAEKYYIYHNPRISYNVPKFWNLNLQPSVNFGMNNFGRKIEKYYDPIEDKVKEKEIQGLYSEYWWSTGARLQTRLYGITQAEFLRKINVKGIRHTVEPSISYNYRPDQSNSDFYAKYIDKDTNEVLYRVFEKDGGGGSSSSRASQNLSYNLNNKFEVKVDKGDSVDAENLELLNFNLNGSYDFEKDSIKFSDIRANFNTPVLEFINFSGNIVFGLYDQDPVYNKTTNEITSYRTVDRTLYESGKGIAKVQSFDIGFGTSFSDKGISLSQRQDDNIQAVSDSTQRRLGGRIFNNQTNNFEDYDVFGDNTPGYAPIDFEWNVNINVNYSNNRTNPLNITETFRTQVTIDLTLTETMKLSGGINYDFINKELNAPQIRVTKDLGCWDMSLNWTPIGIHRSLFFRIGLKASQLKDFQYLLRESNIY